MCYTVLVYYCKRVFLYLKYCGYLWFEVPQNEEYMATKKRAAATNTAAKRRRSEPVGAPREQVIADNVFMDVILWGIIALSGLLFLGLIGMGGMFGEMMRTLLFGMFGFPAYIAPFVIIGGAFFGFSNLDNPKIRLKMITLFIMFLLCCTLAELFVNGDDPLTPIDAFSDSHLYRSGGGFSGALFAWLFTNLFGQVGAYIVTFALLIIGAIIVLEKSPLKDFKDNAPERHRKQRQFVEEKREQIYRDRETRRRHEESIRRAEERRIESERKRKAMQEEAKKQASANEKTGTIIQPASFAPVKEAEVISNREVLKESDRAHSDEISEIHIKVFGEDETEDISEESLANDELSVMDIDAKATRKNQTIADLENDDIKPEVSFANTMPDENELSFANTKPDDVETELAFAKSRPDELLPKVSLANNMHDADEPELAPINITDMMDEPTVTLTQAVHKSPVEVRSESLSKDIFDRSLGTIEVIPEVEESIAPEPIVQVEDEALDQAFAEEVAVTVEETVAPEDTKSLQGTVETVEEDLADPVVKAETVAEDTTTATQSAAVREEEAMASAQQPKQKKPYQFPPVSLLKRSDKKKTGQSKASLQETSEQLQKILKNFGVDVEMEAATCGPTVTRYELKPAVGVKVSKIVNLADDIKLNLAAEDIRIEAPIPGRQAVGIEVPNKEVMMVPFGELVASEKFQNEKSRIAFGAGMDIGGDIIISDIAKMPHVLIAGATGSGKSVCINTIIMSILYKAKPDEVKLIMIDPKVVELSVYNGIPHLLIPVVTDAKKAAGALQWAVKEMMDRYDEFAKTGVRKIDEYNAKIINGFMDIGGEKVAKEKMPKIVVIVDELADLMMVASGEVEDAIVRLTQLARAAGIHLVIATQRPSVNVITGLIKANVPSRIAFAVASTVDSKTILDKGGAEKLLGKGDMLYAPYGSTKPIRVQGAFVSDEEVSSVVSFIKKNNDFSYDDAITQQIAVSAEAKEPQTAGAAEDPRDDKDIYFDDAARLLIDKGKGSIGMLQRNFKIGFNRAARIMDQLADAGIVGPEVGTKPREVLMSLEEYEQLSA